MFKNLGLTLSHILLGSTRMLDTITPMQLIVPSAPEITKGYKRKGSRKTTAFSQHCGERQRKRYARQIAAGQLSMMGVPR